MEAVTCPPELRHKILISLESVVAEDLPAAALDSDKVLLLGVRAASGGYRIEARELDVVTRLWNATVSSETSQPQARPRHALQTLLSAFAPLARIETSDGKTATLRLRAAALARRDRDLPAVAPDAAFRPVLVQSDTRGTLTAGSGEVVAGVYLSPVSTSGSLVTCRVDAGTTAALIPDYHPQRQRLALAVSRSAAATKLRLVSRADPPVPLEGYDVLDGGQLVGRSNREGEVVVASGPQALRMLTIRRGEAPLARVPVVPGLAAEITLPLAASDDSLALDAALAATEDALIDLIAQREVLAARIRAAAKAKDSEGGRTLLRQLRENKAADALATRLDQHQQAIGALDAAAQPRLTARLGGLRQVLDKFRGESPADQLDAELKAAASP
jgi:hypothetical protein